MANLIGKVFENRFRVDAFIATGGMSVVYRVWDIERNVPLAMKVLHLDLADDPSVVKRFQREARALQKLAHPHIVPFYGMYQNQDMIFLVEQFVDGPSLKQILRQHRTDPLPVDEALIYLKALSTALGYAHNNGVVHCDVKPGNVMIDRGGNIYLTDFGVARHSESTTTTLGTAGTPAYMAPEQIRGEPVSSATDVYALGLVLFELVTGQRPFAGGETGSDASGGTAADRVRAAHLITAPPDPRTIWPDVPEGLAAVILKAMSKNPQDRFQNTQILLDAACASMGINPADIPDRVEPPDYEPPPPPEPPLQKRKWPLWVWGVGAVVGILLFLCSAVGTYAFVIPAVQDVLATDTPTSTATLAATLTFTPTLTPTASNTPTVTNTPLPTDTPQPSDTPLPTNIPTDTLTPTPSEIIVTIRNNLGRAVKVWRDGKYMGYIDRAMYLTYPFPHYGTFTLRWCTIKESGDIDECWEKPINVTSSNLKFSVP